MLIIKLTLLMLSSIGIISCSKETPQSRNHYQVRVLQQAGSGDFQARNVTTELNLTDIIYFDSSSSTVLSYAPHTHSTGESLKSKAHCSFENQSTHYEAIFQNNQVSIYSILPPRVLIETLTGKNKWDCNLKLELQDPSRNTHTVLFKNKLILKSSYKQTDFIFKTGSEVFQEISLREIDFRNLYLSKLKSEDSVEFICESFYARTQPSVSHELSVSDVVSSRHIKAYFPSKLDPRLQQLRQQCVFRQSTPTSSFVSALYTTHFKSSLPIAHCPRPNRSFSVSQLQNVVTATYSNPYDFPITFAVRTQGVNQLVNAKWEAGGSREGNGSRSEKNIYFPVSFQTEYSQLAGVNPWTYFWLNAKQSLQIHMSLHAHGVHHLASISLHDPSNICKAYSAQNMFDSFEGLKNLSVYEDPN